MRFVTEFFRDLRTPLYKNAIFLTLDESPKERGRKTRDPTNPISERPLSLILWVRGKNDTRGNIHSVEALTLCIFVGLSPLLL
ncbi:MAG: hypothetical protein V3V21_06695 [Thermoplasmata archaeon]